MTAPTWGFTMWRRPTRTGAYDRACGVMSMTMVGSTYLHRELDPTDLIDYV